MKKYAILTGGLLVVVFAAAFFPWAFVHADHSTITVCVRSSGLIYAIGDGFQSTECANNDELLSWNIEGEPGPQGEPGVGGVSIARGNVYSVVVDERVEADDPALIMARCHDDTDVVLSGSYYELGDTNDTYIITANQANLGDSLNPMGWEVEVRVEGAPGDNVTVFVSALCLSVP